MAFTAGPVTPNPNGRAGVETTFSNDDKTRQIHDTILVFGDPAAAASALDAAKAKLGDSVQGTPAPAAVGTGGTTVSGNSPDGSKGVMMVLFTEGKAFTTLNFVGPPDMQPPPDFVTDLGQKQDTAHQERTVGLSRTGRGALRGASKGRHVAYVPAFLCQALVAL